MQRLQAVLKFPVSHLKKRKSKVQPSGCCHLVSIACIQCCVFQDSGPTSHVRTYELSRLFFSLLASFLSITVFPSFLPFGLSSFDQCSLQKTLILSKLTHHPLLVAFFTSVIFHLASFCLAISLDNSISGMTTSCTKSYLL